MKVLSLFANVGFGEFYFEKNGFNVVVANELLEDRVEFYKKLHPQVPSVICGDICKQSIRDKIIKSCLENGPIDLIIATPPCQGMSMANAQKGLKEDVRNRLIVHAMSIFNKVKPKYMLIENVPQMPKTYISYRKKAVNIIDFIKSKLPEGFKCIEKNLNGKHYGTPQSRVRSICLISKGGIWIHPPPLNDLITAEDAIGHLPSLESGESSVLPWHFSPKHNPNHIKWMSNTATGDTAFNNTEHYPQKDGRKIFGFMTTYKRMRWDSPSPTITMTNGSISSQNNVHPGRIKEDGTYSDARVLTVREILVLCGLPEDCLDKFSSKNLDNFYSYKKNVSFIRKVLGEMLLPKLALSVLKNLPENLSYSMTEEDDFFISGPQDYDEQTDAFRFELDDLVDRYKQEFDINTFVMIGAFQEKIKELIDAGNIDMGDEMLD